LQEGGNPASFSFTAACGKNMSVENWDLEPGNSSEILSSARFADIGFARPRCFCATFAWKSDQASYVSS
jgi:hypothetical protein